MRDDDLHLPEACAGALAVLVLLVAVFVATPAAAAVPTGEPHAYGAGARPAR
jgi:hypothetical protein